MESFFVFFENILQAKVFGDFQLYELLSTIFKYIFVFTIFYFVYNIIRMIYLDIEVSENLDQESASYLKLINRKEEFSFKLNEAYYLSANTSIGREDSNDIVIKDNFISKKHAHIIKDQDLYFIEDLGSANGTYLNGQRIEDAIELKDKDMIDIGRVEFLFVKGEEHE